MLDKTKKLLILVIVSLTVVIVLFIPIIPTNETYNEIEPYERDAKYEVIKDIYHRDIEPNPFPLLELTQLPFAGYNSTVLLKNIDEFDATFSVTHKIYYNPDSRPDLNPDEKVLYLEGVVGEYILSGQTKALIFSFNWIDEGQEPYEDPSCYEWYQLEYTVTSSTVIDQQVITKQRIIYRSIIEILMQG